MPLVESSRIGMRRPARLCWYQFAFRFSQTQEIAVLDAAPTALLGRQAHMTRKYFVHGPRDAFILQDFHAAAGVSRADSELSRTRQAMGRVTEGKHSRNSSKV